jgi:gentisate 1,2-dioxygenase
MRALMLEGVDPPAKQEDPLAAITKLRMADMPAQRAQAPADAAAARARFFNSGNAFNLKLPPVPAAVFAQAHTGVGFKPCDQSAAMSLPRPATTPLMLACYAVVAPGAALRARWVASGTIWYVIDGAGEASVGGERFGFAAGDVFLTPGGRDIEIVGDATLWLVTDEPLFALAGAAPATEAIETVHYPAAEIARQLRRVVEAAPDETTSGVALIFSSTADEASRNILPMLTLSLNTVPPGERQRAHRHNAAAITLILKGEGAYSQIAGQRQDWSPFATLVTPAGVPHSHHNPSAERALFLIVQDGGLHYHARTMSFEFLEAADAAP